MLDEGGLVLLDVGTVSGPSAGRAPLSAVQRMAALRAALLPKPMLQDHRQQEQAALQRHGSNFKMSASPGVGTPYARSPRTSLAAGAWGMAAVYALAGDAPNNPTTNGAGPGPGAGVNVNASSSLYTSEGGGAVSSSTGFQPGSKDDETGPGAGPVGKVWPMLASAPSIGTCLLLPRPWALLLRLVIQVR